MPGPLRRRFDSWFAARNPATRDSILLHNRRLYILPTGFGYLFALMLFFLFLAAINYQNSMAFVLTFMLVSLGILSLWHTHRNLLGVRVNLQTPRAVFAGQNCELNFEVSQENAIRRYAIGIEYPGQAPIYLTLEPAGRLEVKLKIPSDRRGQFKPAGITVFTRYPTGLFHAWGWLQFDQPILVYPKPMTGIKLQHSMTEQYDGKTSTSTVEGDDFAGLREHREGESLRHISWKAYAQGKGLLTKTFQGHARPSLWIDWEHFREGSLEDKLSGMANLVLSADNEDQKYGLKLPGITIAQDSGNSHMHSCLHALAVFRQADGRREFARA